MENIYSLFLGDLCNKYSIIKKYIDDELENWKPKIPPPLFIFSCVEREFFQFFDEMDSNTKRLLFQKIEEGMASKNEQLSTAVATGLIEAMVGQSARHQDVWSRINPELGVLSRKHAEAWMEDGL